MQKRVGEFSDMDTVDEEPVVTIKRTGKTVMTEVWHQRRDYYTLHSKRDRSQISYPGPCQDRGQVPRTSELWVPLGRPGVGAPKATWHWRKEPKSPQKQPQTIQGHRGLNRKASVTFTIFTSGRGRGGWRKGRQRYGDRNAVYRKPKPNVLAHNWE